MKKVLIYHSLSMLKPVGGPSGYLYNLKNGLDSIEKEDYKIDFLPETGKFTALKNYTKFSSNLFLKNVLKIFRRFKHIKNNLLILKQNSLSPVNFHDYDAIHFHSTRDLYFMRNELEDYKGSVILTSHSPQPLSYEYIESSSPLELKIFGKKYKQLIKMDEFAFRRMDNVIFPCRSADEPYIHAWPEYLEIKAGKEYKYRYLLTGTVPAKIQRTRSEVRDQYNIPIGAYVICYVGRHNKIKGYDKLRNIGKRVLDYHPNTYILVAGNIEPLKPINHPRWVEVGWTNDPHSIIAASELFLLPNKETYFDLVSLEVLSLGVPMLVSKTGGNKYFETFNLRGIQLFDTEDDCFNRICNNMKFTPDDYLKISEANKGLFNANFTTEIFAKHYLEVLRSIL